MKSSLEKLHFVYMLRCADGTLYTGYAIDLKKRLIEHNGEGDTKVERSAGAKYTRSRRPVKLVYSESFSSRSEAMQRECVIKKMTKSQKEFILSSVQTKTRF